MDSCGRIACLEGLHTHILLRAISGECLGIRIQWWLWMDRTNDTAHEAQHCGEEKEQVGEAHTSSFRSLSALAEVHSAAGLTIQWFGVLGKEGADGRRPTVRV